MTQALVSRSLTINFLFCCLFQTSCIEKGAKGAGGVREAGEEGREAGEEGREAGEKGKNYPTSCNILQSKKCKEAGANKYRKWEV